MRYLIVFGIYLSLIFSPIFSLQAQSKIFQGTKANTSYSAELADKFNKFESFTFDARALYEYVSEPSNNNTFQLKLSESQTWEIELFPNDMFADEAIIRVLTEEGEQLYPVPRNISFKGHLKGNNQALVSLLVHNDFLYGHISEGGTKTYFASMSKYVKDAPANVYLLFDANDQRSDESGHCGSDENPEFNLKEDHKHEEGERSMTGLCYDVELGIYSDYLMYTDKGTIQATIDHAVAVMMDVESDYETSDFDDALEFEIVEQVISTCDFCEPITSSTASSDVLNDFTSWIDNGGFNNSIDMGQLWTDRDFDGSTVGLAWTNTGLLCNQAHHILQDYTSNADLLRVMTSHEIGHNLSCSHDGGSGMIMSSTVNNTTSWSAASVTAVDAVVDAATPACIVACAATPCTPVTDVSITSINATGFTISWTATTESLYRLRVRDEEDKSIIHTATPSTSTAMVINPAGWEICHQYMVIVENNCGSSVYSAPVSTLVADIDQGCADFSVDDAVGWGTHSVTFSDESTNASSWSWDFGDTNTSTSQNPSHTYTSSGVYNVALTVNSGAHTETKSSFVYVLPSGQTVPYSSADGGDMTDDDFGTQSLTTGMASLFEKGIPSNYFTNSTSCWVTDLDSDMTEQENDMALYSPSYDFSSVVSATVSFDLGMEIQFFNAPFAVQFEYSTDGGSNWTRLGSDSDPSWYNRGPVSGNLIASSIFADEMGWTFTSQGTNYSYDVGFLTGNSSVIFRFVFGLDSGWSGGYARAGAMIDDFEISAVLPVDLVRFDGEKLEKGIGLEWETASEINNDYFILEKSINGVHFESIAFVQGIGNSFQSQQYNFIDDRPSIGTNYYRLIQIDLDGSEKVFDKIVAIDYFGEQEVEVRPNPVSGNNIEVVYQTHQKGIIAIAIYDVQGRLIQQLNVEVDAARNSLAINIKDLVKGVYILQTVQGQRFSSHKFVKN